MTNYRFLSCLFLLLILSCLTVASKAAVTTNVAEILVYDQRIVRDLSLFSFTQVSPSTSWVVADVIPDSTSPSSVSVGAYIQAETGKTVVPPGSYEVITVHGSINILSVLAGIPQPLNRYEWEWKNPERSGPINTATPEENTSFFIGGAGGTAILRINAEGIGENKFFPDYLIPREWTPFVVPALKYVQSHSEMFRSEEANTHRVQLQELLSDANPFIAIAAARTLQQARLLDANFVRERLTKVRGFEQSVFTYLALEQSPVGKAPEATPNIPPAPQDVVKGGDEVMMEGTLAEEVARVVNNAKDSEALKAIALGVSDSEQNTMLERERVSQLLRRVAKRQTALNTHVEADAYLDIMFNLLNVFPRPAK